MNISISQRNMSHIIERLEYFTIPKYQRSYCWDSTKIECFLDSINKDIPIGVFQFRDIGNNEMEVIDGLHRLTTLVNILLGRGIYYDLETKLFTTDSTKYDYSNHINNNNITTFVTISDDINISIAFHKEYSKVYFTPVLGFVYGGTDDEIKTAFDRINDKGISYTPIFNKLLTSKNFSDEFRK